MARFSAGISAFGLGSLSASDTKIPQKIIEGLRKFSDDKSWREGFCAALPKFPSHDYRGIHSNLLLAWHVH